MWKLLPWIFRGARALMSARRVEGVAAEAVTAERTAAAAAPRVAAAVAPRVAPAAGSAFRTVATVGAVGAGTAYGVSSLVSGAGAGLKNMFNTVANDVERNSLYLAVPAAMALGFANGGNIFDKVLEAAIFGAVAYFAVSMMEKSGIKAPGLSSLIQSFTGATTPQQQQQAPAAALPPPTPTAPRLAPAAP